MAYGAEVIKMLFGIDRVFSGRENNILRCCQVTRNDNMGFRYGK